MARLFRMELESAVYHVLTPFDALSANNGAQSGLTFNVRDWQSGETYSANGSTLTSSQLAALNPQLSGTDTYDFEERLILRTRADGTTINLNYDADGNRIQKNILSPTATPVSTTSWLVDTNNSTGYAQVAEERVTTASGTTLRVFTYGHALISQAVSLNSQPSALSYFGTDGFGTVRQLTDATGAATDAYDFDAFGNLIRRTGTTTNAYLYRGEQHDADLGLYYLRARYLNPDSGRFWSMDSYEGSASDPMSLHKYLYAHANPVMFSDPSGHFPSLSELAITASVSATINVVLAIPSIYRNRDSLSVEDIAKQLGKEGLFGAATGVIGGIAGKFALKLAGPSANWVFSSKVMRSLIGKAIEGAGGAGASQISKELYGVFFEGKTVEIKDSVGRVFLASTIGFVVGGVAFKVEPLVTKTGNPVFTNAQGFQQVIPWAEITHESISRAGVAGAFVSDAAEEIIGKWLESSLGFD